MNPFARTFLSLGTTLALTACGSVPTKVFDVRAINFDGNSVPCLVVVDRDYQAALEAERYSDCEVQIAFTKERMNVKLFPTRRDSQGKIVPPDPGATGEYHAEMRELQISDPRVHMFILRTNPDYTGN
jgi:hypothetical protein